MKWWLHEYLLFSLSEVEGLSLIGAQYATRDFHRNNVKVRY